MPPPRNLPPQVMGLGTPDLLRLHMIARSLPPPHLFPGNPPPLGTPPLQVTGLGTPDLFHANMIAREMILSAGMGTKVGGAAGWGRGKGGRRDMILQAHGGPCLAAPAWAPRCDGLGGARMRPLEA